MRERLGRGGARRGWLVALLVVIGASGLVALHVQQYPQVSPIDELQHIDYLDKASRGQIVARGERVSELAMREEVCRGIDAAVPLPSCDAARLHPSQFQEGGFNTAYIHPPTYYGASGVIARGVEALPGFDSLVTAGRLTGALWLGAAIVLLWLALADLGVGVAARAVLSVILVCSPTVLHASTTVNPDATALTVGSAMLLSVLRWEARRWPMVVPLVVAASSILLKSTNVVAVGAAILYIAARHAQTLWAARSQSSVDPSLPSIETAIERTRDRRDALWFVAGVVGAVAVASLGWVVVQSSIAELPDDAIPMVQRFSVEEIGIGHVRSQLGAAVSPLQAPYLPAFMRTSHVLSAVAVVDAALLAGVVIGAVYGGARSRRSALGVASLLAMAAAGPLFVVINFAFVGTFVEIPSRYGLAAVPFALAAASVALERRVLLAATGVYATWLVGITLYALL